jgi:hypothetical protein
MVRTPDEATDYESFWHDALRLKPNDSAEMHKVMDVLIRLKI